MIPKSNSCHIYLKICITIQFEGTDYEYNRPEACNFIEKDTLAQVFSCEFYETSKNTFFFRIPLDDFFWTMLIFASLIKNPNKIQVI